MKRPLFFITVILVTVMISGCLSSPNSTTHAEAAPVLPKDGAHYVIGVDSAYPPFTVMDASGNFSGLDIDAARWIAAREGFTVEFRAVPWDRIIPALNAGTIDMVYSGMTITPDRQEAADFTIPYYTVNLAVAARTGSGITMQDLYSGRLRIGAQAGSTGADWVQNALVLPGKMPSGNLLLYPDLTLLTENLANGTVNASVYDAPPLKWTIMEKPFEIIGEIPTMEAYAVAVRKTDPQIRVLMNDGLRQLMGDPYWKELLKKYRID